MLPAEILDEVGGNAFALLHQARYWKKYAKVQFGQYIWIAKKREDWCRETGLTLGQYKRALTKLKKAGYVETEQHIFGRKPITFLRLLDRDVGHISGTKTTHISGTKTDHTIINNENINTEFKEMNFTAVADESKKEEKMEGENKKKKDIKDMVFGRVKKVKEVAEPAKVKQVTTMEQVKPVQTVEGFLENFKPVHKVKAIKGVDSVLSVYKNVWAEVYGHHDLKFTKKDIGYFSAVSKHLQGEHGLEQLESVLREWADFTLYLKQYFSVYDAPVRPVPWFLAKYGYRIQYFMDNKVAKPKKTATNEPKGVTVKELMEKEKLEQAKNGN